MIARLRRVCEPFCGTLRVVFLKKTNKLTGSNAKGYQESASVEMALKSSGREWEKQVAEYLGARDYRTEIREDVRGHEIDVRAFDIEDETWLNVECKDWDKNVGKEPMRRLKAIDEDVLGTPVIATTSGLTDGAWQLAHRYEIEHIFRVMSLSFESNTREKDDQVIYERYPIDWSGIEIISNDKLQVKDVEVKTPNLVNELTDIDEVIDAECLGPIVRVVVPELVDDADQLFEDICNTQYAVMGVKYEIMSTIFQDDTSDEWDEYLLDADRWGYYQV